MPETMNRAEELFDRIGRRGVAAIDELLADRVAENLFLDFKRSHQDGAGRTLHSDDSINLSAAISGFGNSEGGVLVWGVDCRQDRAGALQIGKHPLLDAKSFVAKLEGASSRLSVPNHSGVHSIAVVETDH